MTEKDIIYFQRVGGSNSDETIRLAYKRSLELDIRDIVVASSHGKTALKCAAIFDDASFNLIAVSISEGYREKGWSMNESEKAYLEENEIKVLTCTHALGGNVNSTLTEEFNGISIDDIVCQTLYRFGEGMKVCVEIAMMAADAGLISVEKEAISIAGTGGGADTAIVIKTSYPRNFNELKILEIIAKPREVNLQKIAKESRKFRRLK